MPANARTSVLEFGEIEWEVYHAMQDLDRAGVYPTMTSVCGTLPTRAFETVRRTRSAILAWGLFTPATVVPETRPRTRRGVCKEPYAAEVPTEDEIREIESARIDTLADSILEFLENREKRGLFAQRDIWAEDHPDIIDAIVEGLNGLSLGDACRAMVVMYDRTFLRSTPRTLA